MRVACVQMCSGQVVQENLDVVAGLLELAAAQGVEMVLLPENFSFMGVDLAAKKQVASKFSSEVVLPFMSRMSREFGLSLVGGSLLLQAADGRLRNSCPVFGSDGVCLGSYDKIHLFDVDLPGETYRESDTVEPGKGPLFVDLQGWRLGLSICYDVRFPELYRHYAAKGCQVLTVPSAFTVPTGQAHWEVLLRARAIENQAWVLAAAQVGTHPGGRRTWGRSLIIDPWGELVAQAPDVEASSGAALIVADMEMERVEQVRARIPALRHSRLGLWPPEV